MLETIYTVLGFRQVLIQTAALCVAAIEAIDRNNRLAPRHWED